MCGGDVGSSIINSIYSYLARRTINGIYSYFIRGAGVNIAVDELSELKRYAIKVVEAENAALYVGRFWMVYVDKITDVYTSAVRITCSDSECWLEKLFEPYWVSDLNSRTDVIVDVSVEYEEWERRGDGTVEYICRINYKYVRYRGIIAVTVDPLDIVTLASDGELRLLLNLVSRSRPLIRPM
jgi:hypothetical protein